MARNLDAHTFRELTRTHPLDRERLDAYLSSIGQPRDPGSAIEQFATGLANINYRLHVSGRPVVLRRPPAGDLPPGAHDMAREHRILSRLHKALPLAPESIHLCEDTSVLGVPFQLIEYRPGLIIKGDDHTHLQGRPDRSRALGRMLVETMAAIHAVDTDSIGLSDLGKPEGFIARAIKGWRGRAERLEPSPPIRNLTSEIGIWLDGQRISDRMPALLHCDLKLDNIILDPDTFAARAVIDWDMGTRGDPLFDLATLLSYWTEPGDPECMHRMAQMPATAPGFQSRREIAELYAETTGTDISDIHSLHILAIYKLAIVFLQLHALRGRGPEADPAYTAFDTLAHDLLEFAHAKAFHRR